MANLFKKISLVLGIALVGVFSLGKDPMILGAVSMGTGIENPSNINNKNVKFIVTYENNNAFFTWYNDKESDKKDIELFCFKTKFNDGTIDMNSDLTRSYKLKDEGNYIFRHGQETGYDWHNIDDRNDNSRRYDVFHIPSYLVREGWHYQIRKIKSDGHVFANTSDYTFDISTYGKCAKVYNTNQGAKISFETPKEIDPWFAREILSNLYTCSDEMLLGFNAMKRLNPYYFVDEQNKSKVVEREGNTIENLRMSDYVHDNSSNQYNGDKTPDLCTVKEKYDALIFMYNYYQNNPKTNNIHAIANNKKVILIVGSSLGGASILGCFGLFLKKRKFN